MNEISLPGCRSTPLASYLKALAVLRLVAEQEDTECSAWWANDVIHLRTHLNEQGLLEFFNDRYCPTPIFNPWGGRSGFYGGSSEKSAREALDVIRKSTTARLEKYRECIDSVRRILEKLEFKVKPQDEDSLILLRALRNEMPDDNLPWLDAVYALTNDGRQFPPLLGTGGNEGSGSYTSGYAQSVVTLILTGTNLQGLRSSLFGDLAHQARSMGQTPGQFDPGRTGGANQGFGISAKTKINPWDYVLSFEGALVFTSAACRKYDTNTRSAASFPFMVLPSGIGYSSAASTDENKPRSELWAPLWSRPARVEEIKAVIAEGRSTLGRRRTENGLDFTRAISMLGVDRGIDSFERFIFLERRGDGYYVALPAGNCPVDFKPNLRLLDDLDPILHCIDRYLDAFANIPATFVSARRNIENAIYECCIYPDHVRFAHLVRAIGRLEQLVAMRDRSKEPALSSPLYGLRPEWIVQCDDGAPEVRIAATLASIRSTGKVGPIRSNMAGVDPLRPRAWVHGNGQRRWSGSTLVDRLGGVLAQRMMDAERFSAPTVPLEAWLEISPRDVVPFLCGETDDRCIEELLWGFTLVDWGRSDALHSLLHRWHNGSSTNPLPRGWCLLKLLYQTRRIRGEHVQCEPRVLQLLRAGRPEEALTIARRRLYVSGLDPLPVADAGWIEPKRQLAGLLVPTDNHNLLANLVLGETATNRNKEKE
jgi:CRISPR-associated protein Csx17